MSDKMIEIKGKKFSEDTIAEALKAQCRFEEEKPYEFRAGDVRIFTPDEEDSYQESIRIICEYGNKLLFFNTEGIIQNLELLGAKETKFYRKIGVISNFIK